MAAGWQAVAFPVILPWREEFWTLPLYFPDLQVGVIPGWPSQLSYRGLSLPPEAEAAGREFKGFRPGEMQQWQAFKEYRAAQEDGEDDLIQAIRRGTGAPAPQSGDLPDPWNLAWQMEKLLADQEARLVSVDRGQEWLAEILAPEPWEERQTLGPVPGIGEMVDPELAEMRYQLWRRVMAPHLKEPWTPLLLGRTSRSLFLTLRGWPQWTGLRAVQIPLPGCRSEQEWQQVRNRAGMMEILDRCGALLAAALTKAAGSPDLAAAALELTEFVEKTLAPLWPLAPLWHWNLEIWAPEAAAGEKGAPVLCWTGAGAGVLPG
ncbi:MAG: hypothetical protein AB1424_04655 [Thermodesulfobacteriota bacterium]